MQYLNIHTHLSTENPSEISVQNFIVGKDETIPTGLFSAGIHPWYLGENVDFLLENLQKVAQIPTCFAIGECGLDRNLDTDLSLQTQVFIQQIIAPRNVDSAFGQARFMALGWAPMG